MADPTAAIQLIVFGTRNQDDIAGVLRDVASAGYPAIEAGNLFAAHGETETRRLLDRAALEVCGAHFSYSEYADPRKLEFHIAYCKAIGIKHMMCSGVADSKSQEGYRISCRLFNEVGARLKGEGITFNYHNHAWEFEDL